MAEKRWNDIKKLYYLLRNKNKSFLFKNTGGGGWKMYVIAKPPEYFNWPAGRSNEKICRVIIFFILAQQTFFNAQWVFMKIYIHLIKSIITQKK